MSRSTIPAGVTVRGDVLGRGDLVVFGRVVGPIAIDGALLLEVGAEVEGAVRANRVVIRGALVGDAEGIDSLHLEPTARVEGDLFGARVAVDEGAQLRGRVRRSTSSPGDVRAPIRIEGLALERCRRRATLRSEPALLRQPSLPGVDVDPAPRQEAAALPARQPGKRRARPPLRMPRLGRSEATRRVG